MRESPEDSTEVMYQNVVFVRHAYSSDNEQLQIPVTELI